MAPLTDQVGVRPHPGVATTQADGERPQGGVAPDPTGLDGQLGARLIEDLEIGVGQMGVVLHLELGDGDHQGRCGRQRSLRRGPATGRRHRRWP